MFLKNLIYVMCTCLWIRLDKLSNSRVVILDVITYIHMYTTIVRIFGYYLNRIWCIPCKSFVAEEVRNYEIQQKIEITSIVLIINLR